VASGDTTERKKAAGTRTAAIEIDARTNHSYSWTG